MGKKLFITTILSLIISAGPICAEGSQYSPSHTIYGTLKSRYEYDTQNGLSRFSVRNSRLGLNGSVSPVISYGIQFELSSNGNFSILDLYASVSPVRNLTLTLGQNSLPFYNSYTVTPNALMFANRPFVGKHFTGTRDIGLKADYKFDNMNFPITLQAGVYNGGSINEPVWDKKMSYVFRIIAGEMNGFRTSVKLYKYPLAEDKDYLIMGADLRYQAHNWRVEGELMSMKNYFDKSNLTSYYIQGDYNIPLKNTNLITCVVPAVRFDNILSHDYQGSSETLNTSRITIGVGFPLAHKFDIATFRINYEHYLHSELNSVGPLADMYNKLTFEFLINF